MVKQLAELHNSVKNTKSHSLLSAVKQQSYLKDFIKTASVQCSQLATVLPAKSEAFANTADNIQATMQNIATYILLKSQTGKKNFKPILMN